MSRDVFLCHASEDKAAVVRILYDALRSAGVSCWLDEAEIVWGDSIADKINDGLRSSQFVIVVLSTAFLSKPWPRRELASALSIESSAGVVRVLPLLVGSSEERKAILTELPLLADKLHLVWDGNARRVAEEMQRRVAGPQRPAGGTENASVADINQPITYCTRCGVGSGRRSECVGGYTSHTFTTGTRQEFCRRCGIKAGSRAECTGGYTSHNFTTGTGREFCKRCGTRAGSRAECTGGYTSHDLTTGTGQEFCKRCGTKAGSRAECTGGYTHHNF